MDTPAALRRKADHWFRFAKVTTDARLKAKALALGRQCLDAAESCELACTANSYGHSTSDPMRLSPLQRAAMGQIARLDAQIAALRADGPPPRSARANILATLCQHRAALLQNCGLTPANDSEAPP
jgi:hypothetical protein